MRALAQPQGAENHVAKQHHTCPLVRGRASVKRLLEGETPSAAMKSYGLYRTTIYPWLRAHKKGAERAPATASPQVDLRQGSTPIRVRLWFVNAADRWAKRRFILNPRQADHRRAEMVEGEFDQRLSLTAVGWLLAPRMSRRRS